MKRGRGRRELVVGWQEGSDGSSPGQREKAEEFVKCYLPMIPFMICFPVFDQRQRQVESQDEERRPRVKEGEVSLRWPRIRRINCKRGNFFLCFPFSQFVI
jgi:hypothetical protein